VSQRIEVMVTNILKENGDKNMEYFKPQLPPTLGASFDEATKAMKRFGIAARLSTARYRVINGKLKRMKS